jgi:hypothetical protein
MDHRTDTTAEDWKKKRDGLTIKRNTLFKKYSQNPHDHHLSLEIKKIDDEVADCTDKMRDVKLSARKSK